MADTKYTTPRYSGYIPCRTGECWWLVEIFLAADQGRDITPAELTFPDEEPLTIEWDEMPPEEVFQASSATLRVESMSDREFIDLYAHSGGEIWLRVTRCRDPRALTGRSLWWQGTLDPEQYEEPYESASGYTVALTFTDFGCMDREKYVMDGMRTLRVILYDALERTGWPPSADLVQTAITTAFPDGEAVTLDSLAIASANWYDEEGEAATLREVITGILLPLGLHITQRAGHILIYDLNAQALAPSPVEVYWSSDTQTLATAQTYNNVRITFSPYASGELYGSASFEYGGKTDTAHEWINYLWMPVTWYTDDKAARYGMQFTWSYDLSQSVENPTQIYDLGYASFALFCHDVCKGATLHQETADAPQSADGLGFEGERSDGRDYVGAPSYPDGGRMWPKAFSLVPFGEGEEAEGIAVGFTAGYGLLENTFGYEPKTAGGKAVGYKVCRYGALCDTPWGYGNYGTLYDHWTRDVANGQYRYDLFDYMCDMAGVWKRVYSAPAVTLPPAVTASVKVCGPDGDIASAPSTRRVPYYIRIEQPMLLDARYNPLTDASEWNQEEHQKRLLERSRWVFIPFTAVLRDADGHIKYVYSNRRYMFAPADGRLAAAEGEWIPAGYAASVKVRVEEGSEPGADATSRDYFKGTARMMSRRPVAAADPDDARAYAGQAWLAYYASDPIADASTGVGGWQSNRHFIGRPDVIPSPIRLPVNDPAHDLQLPAAYVGVDDDKVVMTDPFRSLAAGQYIPYPPAGGTLEVTVFQGVLGFDATEKTDATAPARWLDEEMCYDRGDGRRGIFNLIRWQMFKPMTIEIVRNDMSYDSAGLDDVEYSGYLDRGAHEELTLDTVTGTVPDPCPAARGLLLRSDTLAPVTDLVRGGVTDCPERLLTGTLYSQYARRRTSLTGEARIVATASGAVPPLYTDAAQDDWCRRESEERRYFYEYSRCDDCIGGVTDLTLMQISPDDYEASDIEEVVAT